MPRVARPAGCAANWNRLLRALGITTIYGITISPRLRNWVVIVSSSGAERGDAQIGTPREIYFTPQSRFVAEFIGAANIVEAPSRASSRKRPGGRQPILSRMWIRWRRSR